MAVFCRSLLHDWGEELPGAGSTCGECMYHVCSLPGSHVPVLAAAVGAPVVLSSVSFPPGQEM